MSSKISQREAHRLRKRVKELQSREESRNNAWTSSYPGGVNVATLVVDAVTRAHIETSLKLGHAVVVKRGHQDQILFYALKP